jgi:hypothetical protein
MSYSLVIARRRIEALERRPSALKPMRITGGIPADNRATRTPPGPKPNWFNVCLVNEQPNNTIVSSVASIRKRRKLYKRC